jgi:ketosteroid isomerase-like protein
MPRRAPESGDDFTEEDRRAIDEIRRELDAEFGPLERPAPLTVELPPVSAAVSRGRRRQRVRAVPLFLLGALVGGAVGGITGGLTALLWRHHADVRGVRAPAHSSDRGAAAPSSARGASPGSRERGAAVTDSPAAATPDARPEVALESALNDWLAATKAGDVETQMRFYPARMPVYYTWRNVTRQAVRTEKDRVFGAATRLEITTDIPTVEMAADGASAVSRFRKRYVIEGPNIRRRGEVLQELRWTRTPDGWRIVVERDAEVLSPSASVGPGRASRGGTIDPARRERHIRAPT